jgi:glutamine cyclotransferase
LAIAVFFTLSLTGTPGLYAQHRTAPVVKPQILRVIRHDPAAFTQGLIFIDSTLYESTGLVGRSSLRRVNPLNGDVISKISIPEVFAEGITVLNGELVQLTWRHGFAMRYEFPSLRKKEAVFRYDGEGWGLTNDGTNFIMSNGSDTIYFRNGNFEVVRRLPVTLNGTPLVHLNELQYLRGHIYANVWYRDFIVEISASNGSVRRVIDCSELMSMERPRSRDDVFNGIAYCERGDEWYLTGKNWRNMFVVRIP